MRFVLLIVLLFTAGPVAAQGLPEFTHPEVNDQANIIDPETEIRLGTALAGLRNDTGVQATILTLATRRAFAKDTTIEDFADIVFFSWGIGGERHEDAIFILVLHEDREMRIQLGEAYGTVYNETAQNIVDFAFLPAFRNQQFALGIEAGTLAVIDLIARAHRR